jgi:hypothetical protein
MGLPSDKASFTFNHDDQVDEYGRSVGDKDVVQQNFDSRAEEMRVFTNSMNGALKATTGGDSGADNIGSATISDVSGNTVWDQMSDLKTQIDTKAATADTYTTTQIAAQGFAALAGFTPYLTITSVELQSALEELKDELDGLVVGEVPDLSITTAKLANSAVTTIKIDDGAVTDDKIEASDYSDTQTITSDDPVHALPSTTVDGFIKELKVQGQPTAGASGDSLYRLMVIGKNNCDNSWELGKLNDSTGAEEASAVDIRTEFFHPCNESTDYTASFSASGTVKIHFWTIGTGSYIENQTITTGTSFTSPANAYLFKIEIEGNTDVETELMLVFGTSGETFEPYISAIVEPSGGINFDESGGVFDELILDEQKFIQRISGGTPLTTPVITKKYLPALPAIPDGYLIIWTGGPEQPKVTYKVPENIKASINSIVNAGRLQTNIDGGVS